MTKSKQLKDSLLEYDYYRGNIVFVIHYRHKTFRYRVLKVPENCFDKRTKTLKPCEGMYDFDYEVNRIKELYTQVNSAVVDLLKTKDTLTVKDVDEHIHAHQQIISSPEKQTGLITDFETWIEGYKDRKRKEEIKKGKDPRENHPSSKDYTSTKNLLKDFEYDNYDTPIVLSDINDDFIINLIEYCYESRISTEEHKYATEGNMVNKTIQKRMDCLFTFLHQNYKQIPSNVIKPKLDVLKKKVIRLDTNELKQLLQADIIEERFVKIRDYFIFLSFTGLRFGDFVKIDETFYDKEENELVLTTEKTSCNCRIFLFDIAKQIGEKYNFSFKDYTNQAFNRAIKDMLEKLDLYKDDITIDFMQKGRKTLTRPKRSFITCHTGRKSFISNMIEHDIDVYQLMGMTGHTKVDTLKFYVDLFGRKKKEKLQLINQSLIQELWKNKI